MTDRCSIESVTDARNDAANDHLSCAVGCYLQYSANSHNRGAKDDGLLPAEHLPDGEGAHGAKEAPDVI